MKTIKELREKDVLRLAERLTAEPTAEDLETARKTMRKFYRFVAAYQNSFYTEQSRTASQAMKDEADRKSENAYRRAADALKVYGLKMSLPGLYPIIEDAETRINFTYGHFYG